jgi:purine-binding chemotaxis protein CheW
MSEQDASRYLLFTLRDSPYAIDLQQVAEVIEPPPLCPIPRAPAHFIGAMNSHGNIKPVLDLALMLNQGRCSPAPKVMVLEDRLANLAIQVDGVLAIISTEGMEMKAAGSDDGLGDSVFTDGEREIALLNLDRLLQRLEATIND